MAGAGGTGPQKPAFDLHDFLAEQILKELQAPKPQAPQPPQQQALDPASAYAAARNPQFAPHFIQRANAPEQARYASQQAAFEAAMSGRERALQAGVGLVGSQARAARSQRAIKAEVNRDVNGQTRKFVQFYDPQTNELIGEHDLGPVGYAPAMLATPEGFQRAPKTGNTPATPVVGQGGQPVYANPPAGIVSDIAAGTANLQGLESLRGAYQKIRAATTDDWKATKMIGTVAGETRLGGMLAPKYAEYTAARRASLNAYIKSVTGAQFSVAELQRYEGQYPEPWDDETLAEQKIRKLEQRSLADMQAKMRAFPGAAGAGPQQTESVVDKAMRLAAEARAKGGQSGSPNP